MDKIICYCKNVSKATVLKSIAEGAKTLKDIKEKTGACTGNKCKELNPKGTCCSTDIEKLLNIADSLHTCNCGCSAPIEK